MAAPPKKASQQAVQAELALTHSLKSCLVNLPASLVAVLVNANAVAQNVVVELNHRQATPPNPDGKSSNQSPQNSVFVGWTGMQSKRKLAPVVGRDGFSGSRGAAAGREQETPTVEIDATFGRSLGLNEGQKVGVLLHLDPPQAHTINIEPSTPADWEMIELHAQFLELNFLSQIRALPNPSFSPSPDAPHQTQHPLTLHLSPTSSANVIVTSLTPSPPAGTAFVKISPDAEVIVAPKTRQRSERNPGRESRSVTSTSRKSVGAKSGASTVRHKSSREESSNRGPVFLRGVDRSLCDEYFDNEASAANKGLRVWLDPDVLVSKTLRGVTWVCVSIVKPAGLLEPIDPQKEVDTVKPAIKLVARVDTWGDAPTSQHAALSSLLCSALGSEGFVGGLVRIEAAPPQASKSGLRTSAGKETVVKVLRVHPFSSAASQQSSGLRFGGESKQEREEAAQKLRAIYGKSTNGNGLLDGPLTDGMVLPPITQTDQDWQGGILRFDPSPGTAQDGSKASPSWFLGPERKLPIEVQPEIVRPVSVLKSWMPGEPLPLSSPVMVGIDPLIDQVMAHILHSSSVLLTGGFGAGKSSLAHLIAHRLRSHYLYTTIYFPCRTLVTDETRVLTIKETLNRVFASASWGARLGGRSVVILDDLDRLCPVETELQVGGENGRSRHISESICSIVRQYCSIDSGVVLLATAQGKESLNNVIIGGHVVREIVSLKAPNKEGRRRVLETLVYQNSNQASGVGGAALPDTPRKYNKRWSDGSLSHSRSSSSNEPEGFNVDGNIDFLDLAGQTDGYMPGDLVLLVSRARSEALIRSVSEPHQFTGTALTISREDFARALQGFTPASLRNVTLQSSTTRWDSIGGLQATRQTLLETLQYPTTYAPIFEHCPLRLRSGLLLYGYPGCGKTLLASAVAGECGLNFISVKGPEILNKYIGASEKSVRDLFERAEAARPCVLFFDEFDSIAPKRGHDSTGVTDRVVNQLLTQMDGAEGLTGVYVLAATSRPDLIDPALLRPGRLDKSLVCDLPGLEDRVDILRALSRKLRFEGSVLGTDEGGQNLLEIARRTDGYSGADLQAVVYNAQLEAIHDVLGDHGDDGDFGSKDARKGKAASNGTARTSKSTPDFIYFRLGDLDGTPETSSPLPSSALTERATIAAKIASMQAARRREKQIQHSEYLSDPPSEKQGGEKHGSKEPTIHWRHMVTSLSTTRASISPEERRRLAGIYREFVVGRNGEMPSGQGGNEIGGRTSLM